MHAVGACSAPVCVGLDPVLQRLPQPLQPRDVSDEADAAEALQEFSLGVLDAIAGIVPCVKIQAACYERYHHSGYRAMFSLIAEARARDLHVILDWKRGDIGISAEHYAAAAFDIDAPPDWVTVHSYLGVDGIQPFLRAAGGAFALVRTSNPSSASVQESVLTSGSTVADGIADLVHQLGAESLGTSGFSRLGAVVGATDPAALRRLRERMPHQIFLVPGFGAQGGGVADVLPAFLERGRGAVITASRSIIYAYERAGGGDWKRHVADAANRFADNVGSATGYR